MFACTVAAAIVNYSLEKIKLGYNLKALRDSEMAAESLGIDIFWNKVAAFVVSAFFGGLIGGVYAYWITYVHPYNVFDGLITDRIIVMVLIGGRGTLVGPLIGVTLLRTIFEVLWTKLPAGLYLVFLGLIIIIAMMFLPTGIVGTWRKEGWKIKKALFKG
jgi:branched-chain amino acid transport system permease protein